MAGLPLLYTELAEWFHLVTHPDDYADEAAHYAAAIDGHATGRVATLLELGAGGGNTASHLGERYRLTLTDLSAAMLDQSRQINPAAEHIVGDMRTLDLGRMFDAVLLHDAVMYLTTRQDLERTAAVMARHCRAGGVALIVPDVTIESLVGGTHVGGHDDADRSVRYLEWTWDPDPNDTTFRVEFAFILRSGDDVRHVADHHIHGVFARWTWLDVFDAAGFDAVALPGEEGQQGQATEMFLGIRRES